MSLYIVATPIGNLEDMTQRAIRILSEVDVIAAEDTRHSRHLLDHFGIQSPMVALHEHNEDRAIAGLMVRLLKGESVALISDAGTPLVSDPGYLLVRRAREAGVSVVPVPGACAAITALSVAGLPTDRFVFEGFLPAKAAARRARLEALSSETRTLIFYEAPHRIVAMVEDLVATFGPTRFVVLARELTKTFETVHGASAEALLDWLQSDANQQKGEFVVLVQGSEEVVSKTEVAEDHVLSVLMAALPLKQAVDLAAGILGAPRNALYRKALKSAAKNSKK